MNKVKGWFLLTAYCIEHDVLKTFLLKHRAEVKDVCITEYDEKTFVDGIRAEGRAEGVEL